MAIVFTKVIWYAGEKTVATDITDAVDFSAVAGLEAKTNMATLVLKNSWWNAVDSGSTDNKEPFNIHYNDIIEIYIDNSPIDTTYKGSSNQLIFRGYVQEIGGQSGEGKRDIKIKCVDVTTRLLNRVWAYDRGLSDEYTPPDLIQYVCRSNTDSQSLTKSYAIYARQTDGSVYPNAPISEDTTTLDGNHDSSVTTITVADASSFKSSNGIITIDNEQIEYEETTSTTFTGCTRGANRSTAASHTSGATVTESGYIQSKTEPTSGDHLASGSAFDAMGIQSGFIPVYEWMKRISERKNLQSSSIEENRGYTFYVDRFGYLHWFYPYNATDYDLTEGQDRIINFNLNRSLIKSYNMIIFDGGTDCNGSKIIWYKFNTSTTDKELKIKYETYVETATNLKKAEQVEFKKPTAWSGGSAATTANHKEDNAYPDSWPSNYTPSWTSDTYNSNATYNAAFKAKIKTDGEKRAQTTMNNSTTPLWDGTIELIGTRTYIAGDNITFTSTTIGLKNQQLRITDVNHKFSKGGWFTSISVEEDPLTG